MVWKICFVKEFSFVDLFCHVDPFIGMITELINQFSDSYEVVPALINFDVIEASELL